MAYSAPSTRSTSDLITAAIWNADLVANEIAIYAGALSVTSQAVGDILYASSTTQFARVAAVAAGQVLTSAGTGTVPAYSATPALTSVDMGGTTVYGSRAITVDTGGVLNVVLASAAGDDFTIDTSKFVVEGDTGNVGIGTAAPGGKLVVAGASDNSGILRVESTTDHAINTGGSIAFMGRNTDSSTNIGTWGIIRGYDESAASGNGDGYMAFDVGKDGGAPQERMRISSLGRVYMPAVYSVSGDGAALNIESDGNLYRIASARRYKDNINYDNVDGDLVYGLKPVSYTLKALENPVERVGFIAEDVEEIDPRLVVYSKEGTVDALHYDRVTVFLVKAMQDLKTNYDATITQLAARIAALESTDSPSASASPSA
jgi:hypothetical protein